MAHDSDKKQPAVDILDDFFAVFSRVDRNRRKVVTKSITELAKPTAQYYVLVALSVIVITLGLLINSESVVIGGMLIAPILPVLQALSLSTVRGSIRLFHRSISTLIVSLSLGILLSFFVTLIVPFNGVSEAVLARTEPDFLFLVIALAAGLVGAIDMIWPSISSLAAGVVVAAALVPPLAVVGIGLAKTDWVMISQSFILFATNLVAVIFAGIVLLLIAGFRPYHRAESVELLWKNIFWSIILLLVVAVPLGAALSHTANREEQHLVIERSIKDIMGSQTEIERISISTHRDTLNIKVRVLSRAEPTDLQWSELKDYLHEQLGKEVLLELDTILVSQRIY